MEEGIDDETVVGVFRDKMRISICQIHDQFWVTFKRQSIEEEEDDDQFTPYHDVEDIRKQLLEETVYYNLIDFTERQDFGNIGEFIEEVQEEVKDKEKIKEHAKEEAKNEASCSSSNVDIWQIPREMDDSLFQEMSKRTRRFRVEHKTRSTEFPWGLYLREQEIANEQIAEELDEFY